VFEHHGFTEVADALRIRAREQQWSTMPALISDEILDTFVVSGAPEEVFDRLNDRYSGLVDCALVYDAYRPSDEETWTRLLRGRS
jgi:alkanesulfonate monooxygenase SsuD/methylene tetrahydromethanopterin reductase-like flavin-dependent oxidoreductase (luciferase family)